VEINDAMRWHATLAQALVGVWASAPDVHEVLQHYLSEWEHNPASSQAAFLTDVAQHLNDRGASPAVVDAINASTVDGDKALDMMFVKLVYKAKVEYEALSSWGVVDHVKLNPGPQTEAVFPDRAPYGALGATACVPSLPGPSGMPSSTVKLTLVPALLGPPTWASLPSLLCHELIAHVNQASPMKSVDPFGEGWMDVVAGQYCEAWIGELFPQCREFAIASARQLTEVTTQRYPGLTRISDKTRAVRVNGTLAARQVQRQVTALVKASGRSPNREFERLSLQLNRVAVSAEKREAFVSAVIQALNGSDVRVARRWAECIYGWLRQEIPASDVLLFS
jgi:hypothetical protein